MNPSVTKSLALIADMLGAETSGLFTMHRTGQHSMIANGHSAPSPPALNERPAGRAKADTTQHPATGIRRRLEHRYSVTRAEAELNVLLARVVSPEGISSSRAVKHDTARTQLLTAYKKTGSRRQGELVCLVGMPIPSDVVWFVIGGFGTGKVET